VAVLTLTLFPVRLLVALLMMLLAWPLALVSSLGPGGQEPEQPPVLWRRVVDVLLRAIMRTMWFAGGFHHVAVKGRRALPTEAAILALAPHSSYFDAIPITMTMSSVVMKAESRDIPMWGSAFIPGVPVQPVVLRYPNKLFLPVYTPSEEERKDPALYASNVRRVMAEALGVSVTDYTFEDCQLALAEGQLRLPADTCLLEFARLLRGLGLKPEKLEQDLDRHAESARMKQGRRVTLPEFAAQLGVPESESLEDLFSLFDEGGGGEVDLREYVVALSVVCRPARTLDTIQLADACPAPQMYGSQDGSVDEHALSSILKTALGVAELTVTDLFRAIDQERKGRIAFADFERFAEANPNFAEEYLYSEQTRLRSCARTPPAPTPNGFCADFSPENSAVGTEPVGKKLD
ncbi:hypothetical protein G4228_016518, partial [Cervus hanglu yarkandensis]